MWRGKPSLGWSSCGFVSDLVAAAIAAGAVPSLHSPRLLAQKLLLCYDETLIYICYVCWGEKRMVMMMKKKPLRPRILSGNKTVRVLVSVSDEHHEMLKQIAKKRGVSMALIVREKLEELLG